MAAVEMPQPKWGTRGESPGIRGCWAVKKDGQPCGAAVRNDSDFCNAHSGHGLAANPAQHSLVGRRRSAEVRRDRAELRLILGSTRLDSPRMALRAEATRAAERLARTTVAAALDPALSPAATVRACLDVIEAAEPKVSATAVISGEFDPASASLGQLMALATQQGIDLTRPEQASPAPTAPPPAG